VQERCDKCGTPIFWAETEKGTPIPIDYSPDPDAPVVLLGNVAIFVAKERRHLYQTNGRRLWVPHARLCRGKKAAAGGVA